MNILSGAEGGMVRRGCWIALALACLAAAVPSASAQQWADTGTPRGVYFYWYEPSFYTGFAPRCQEPERIRIVLGRGNQLRLTVVLGRRQVDDYPEDLILRRNLYRELVDRGVIELTQNSEYEAFLARLDEAGVEAAAAARPSVGPDRYRERSLELMQRLNHGRVFHVRLPADPLLDRWRLMLAAQSRESFQQPETRVAAVNDLLPGRVNRNALDTEVEAALDRLVSLAGAPADQAAFRLAAAEMVRLATGGRYEVRDGFVEAWEFTAVYPAGTAESWVTWNGKRLPDFGVTGVWPLIPRTKGQGLTGMVDYLSPNPGYGFITMLPYQYAGGIAYNAIHNPGVRCNLADTPFLPPAWRKAPGIRDPKRAFQNLWVISRGPVSHGCTRLAAGHMSELRHVLPSASEDLEKVATWRTLPQCYDVFDIDGSGTAKVIGVKYYLAYSCTRDRIPYKILAPNSRAEFYQWLYAGELRLDDAGRGVFAEALDCRFSGRVASEGEWHRNIPLREAEYEPDRIQFYRLRPASFESERGFEMNRELRRAGLGYAARRNRLFLE